MKLISYNIRSIIRLVAVTFLTVLMSSCNGNKPDEGSKEEPGHEAHGAHEGMIELTEQALNAVDIVIGGIEQKNLTEVVKSSGQLAVPPQNAAQVNVLSGGIIRKINVIEGQKVSKGQVLVTIENQELIQLQQEYLTAKGGYSFIASEYERQMRLKAANAGTGKAQQQAEANYNAERAKIKALERQLQQYGISVSKLALGNISTEVPVRSPINGTIGKISAGTGSYAQPGVSIMDIVDNSKIHADLIVFEKDLSKIKVGQKVDFQLTNQKNEPIEGVIYGINKSFENDSKGVVVHAVIKKPGANLIPGMYVTGLIGIGTAQADAVPVDAVVRAAGREFIFIVQTAPADAHEHKDGDGHDHKEEAGHEHKPEKMVYFRKVEVTTGTSELGYVRITPLEKLPADVRLVTKGAFYLQSKSSGPAEHSH